VIAARDPDAPRTRPGQPSTADPNKKAVQGYYVFALPNSTEGKALTVPQ